MICHRTIKSPDGTTRTLLDTLDGLRTERLGPFDSCPVLKGILPKK